MRRTERTHYTHLFIIYLFDIIYVKDLAPAVLAPDSAQIRTGGGVVVYH